MVKKASRGQLLQLAGMLAQSIPADLLAPEIQRWIDDPDGLREAIHLVLKLSPSEAAIATSSGETSVVIHPPASPWWNLFASCRQQFSNPRDFTEENFPLEPVAPDEEKWRIYEHYFPEQVRGEEAYRRLKEMGFRRLSGMRRALEFISKNLHLQLEHPVVVTASWRSLQNGREYLPVFGESMGKRRVTLRPFQTLFPVECGWLVLEKVPR